MDHLMLQSPKELQPASLPLRLPLAPQPQPTQTTSSSSLQASASQLQASTPLLAVSALLDSIATIETIRNCMPRAPVPINLQQMSPGSCTVESSLSSASSAEYLLDRKARKKDQNRRAALNYRRKKMEEKNHIREEEMRLVYSRVCQIGYAEQLDKLIMYILETKTTRIPNKQGSITSFLCPLCPVSCDSTINLRSHLNIVHYSSNNPC